MTHVQCGFTIDFRSFVLVHIFLCNGFFDDKLDRREQTRVSVMAITGPEAWVTNVQYAFMVICFFRISFVSSCLIINILLKIAGPESRNYG